MSRFKRTRLKPRLTTSTLNYECRTEKHLIMIMPLKARSHLIDKKKVARLHFYMPKKILNKETIQHGHESLKAAWKKAL